MVLPVKTGIHVFFLRVWAFMDSCFRRNDYFSITPLTRLALLATLSLGGERGLQQGTS